MGAGGARIWPLRMASKCEEREWRPGSIFMEEDRDLMKIASPYPVMLAGQDGNVLFAEVVLLLACMLEHSRLIFAQCVGGG